MRCRRLQLCNFVTIFAIRTKTTKLVRTSTCWLCRRAAAAAAAAAACGMTSRRQAMMIKDSIILRYPI